MERKVKVTISIRPMLKSLAEKFGINLSASLEDALIQRLRDLVLIEEGKNAMLRPGFEPGSRDRESRMIGRATPPELINSQHYAVYKTCSYSDIVNSLMPIKVDYAQEVF